MSWQELGDIRQRRLRQQLRAHPLTAWRLNCLDCGAKPFQRCVYIWPDSTTQQQRDHSTSATMTKYRARIGKPMDSYHPNRIFGGMSPLSTMVRNHEAWAPVIEMFQEMEK